MDAADPCIAKVPRRNWVKVRALKAGQVAGALSYRSNFAHRCELRFDLLHFDERSCLLFVVSIYLGDKLRLL